MNGNLQLLGVEELEESLGSSESRDGEGSQESRQMTLAELPNNEPEEASFCSQEDPRFNC